MMAVSKIDCHTLKYKNQYDLQTCTMINSLDILQSCKSNYRKIQLLIVRYNSQHVGFIKAYVVRKSAPKRVFHKQCVLLFFFFTLELFHWYSVFIFSPMSCSICSVVFVVRLCGLHNQQLANHLMNCDRNLHELVLVIEVIVVEHHWQSKVRHTYLVLSFYYL